MNVLQAQRFVENHGLITVYGYKWLTHAKEYEAINPVVTATWGESFRNKHPEIYPLVLSKQTTFEDCVRGSLFMHENKLHLQIDIYEGTLDWGIPNNLRCIFVLKVNQITDELKSIILAEAMIVAEDQYKKQQEEEHQALIEKKAYELLYSTETNI